VIAQEVRGRGRDAGFEEDVKFQQTGRPAVTVVERVDPGQIEVRDNRLQDGER